MSDYQEILYSVDGPSAVITLNRPDALNALTNNMMTELKHALAAAEQDEQVVGIIFLVRSLLGDTASSRGA